MSLAKMAEIDLQRLRAGGYLPTDAQVVRLNDLAVRIERGKHTTVANMPRTGCAGNVVLHEPTIAALEWWHQFGRDAAWTTRGKLNTYYWMLAHAEDPDAFEGLEDSRSIRRAVRIWQRKVFATEGELWRALIWVRSGENPIEEDDHPAAVTDSVIDDETFNHLARLTIAAACALGVAPKDLKCETQTTLVALIARASQNSKKPMKPSVAKDYIAYQRTIREIESNGRREQ